MSSRKVCQTPRQQIISDKASRKRRSVRPPKDFEEAAQHAQDEALQGISRWFSIMLSEPAKDLKEQAERAQEIALREITRWFTDMPLEERFDRLRLRRVYQPLRKYGVIDADLERLFEFVEPIASRHLLICGRIWRLERKIAGLAKSEYRGPAIIGLAEEADRLVEELDRLCRKVMAFCNGDGAEPIMSDRRLLIVRPLLYAIHEGIAAVKGDSVLPYQTSARRGRPRTPFQRKDVYRKIRTMLNTIVPMSNRFYDRDHRKTTLDKIAKLTVDILLREPSSLPEPSL